MQSATPELSPTYSTRQRILHIVCAFFWAIPAIVLSFFYVFPWAQQVSEQPCALTFGPAQ